jgi:hypothetical protein
MKRWSKIVAIAGFLIVLAFVAERFLGVRTLWASFSWTDLRDLAHDLGGFWLFILMNTAILLVIIVIFWGGYLWWKEIRPKQGKDRFAEPQSLFGARLRHVVELSVLSVVLALTATGLTKMRTPGWWVAGMSYKSGKDLDLRLFIGSVIAVDSAICFAVLWGVYLLWVRIRQERSQ